MTPWLTTSAECVADEIRHRRMASNAAIKARDPDAIVAFVEDSICVTTSAGETFIGKESMRARFSEVFSKNPDVSLVRTPQLIEASVFLPHAAESGRWKGRWTESGHAVELEGSYMALWAWSANVWRLRVELFVGLEQRMESTAQARQNGKVPPEA